MQHLHFDQFDLTPNEKNIADFISKNGLHILTFTEDEIAKSLHVSNATVSRFWRKIGFKNFKDFKQNYKNEITVSPAHKLENIMDQMESSTLQQQMMDLSKKHLELTLAQFDESQFQIMVSKMIHAKNIYIYSPGPSEGLGNLLHFRLSRLGFSIKLLPKSGHEIYEELIHFTSEDLIFVFGFVKMHPESQVLLEYAKALQIPAIVMTDCLVSDFNHYTDYLLFVSRGEIWEFHSMIAPTFLIENIIIAIGKEQSQKSLLKLEQLDDIRKQFKHILPR